MLKLSKLGVKIVPPSVAFYNNIESVDDFINFVVGKTLELIISLINSIKGGCYE
jgi:3-polyprenyl-4-hydroxybenzoate decarboxylase